MTIRLAWMGRLFQRGKDAPLLYVVGAAAVLAAVWRIFVWRRPRALVEPCGRGRGRGQGEWVSHSSSSSSGCGHEESHTPSGNAEPSLTGPSDSTVELERELEEFIELDSETENESAREPVWLSAVPDSLSDSEDNSSLDLKGYRIFVAESVQDCEEFVQSQSGWTVGVVGLDCEWRGEGGRVPVALLQLAFPSGACLLLRLCETGAVPPCLADILTDRSILKFGVGIATDAKRLASGSGVQLWGCVDLQHIAARCGIKSGTSLQGLAWQLLGAELDKSRWLRCSDWEAPLSNRQVRYAATDAIVALQILRALLGTKLSQQYGRRDMAAPATETRAQLSKSCVDLQTSLCQGIVDVSFKQPRRHSAPGKSRAPQRTRGYSTRQSPLYHNCHLLAPDGHLLSIVDRRKLDWYLTRDLGTLVSETPPTVQLRFEPAGRPSADRQYYLTPKENVCVVCGEEKNCLRKHIIPHEYRRFFPSSMKEHLSHDVLLLCVGCHQLASQHDSALRQQIAAEFCVPLNVSTHKFSEDPRLLRVKSYARALAMGNSEIPQQRKKELLETIAWYFGCHADDVTADMIQEATAINAKSKNAGYISHAEVVVAKVSERGDLGQFQRRWRQHFLESMRPRFLPPLWSVEHSPAS